MSTKKLNGKTAIITGSSYGIGKGIALLFAKEGANIVINYSKSLEKAQQAVSEIIGLGSQAIAVKTDVSQSSEVKKMMETCINTFGSIEILVNNAGILPFGPIEEITDEILDRVFKVNFYGTFYCCRAVLPEMIARRFGRIVNMSSLHALRGQALASHYSAVKGGIIGFTKALAREVASYGILVNAVAPGPIDTPLWRGSLQGAELEAQIARRVEVIALGRLGEAREVANVILFLLSPASSYMTGQVITIDGGELMA